MNKKTWIFGGIGVLLISFIVVIVNLWPVTSKNVVKKEDIIDSTEKDVKTAVLQDIQGDVYVIEASDGKKIKATNNMKVEQGWDILTGKGNSSVQILFGSDEKATLGHDAHIVIDELTVNETKRRVVIQQLSGSAWHTGHHDDYIVKMNHSSVKALGTSFLTVSDEKNLIDLTGLFSGILEVENEISRENMNVLLSNWIMDKSEAEVQFSDQFDKYIFAGMWSIEGPIDSINIHRQNLVDTHSNATDKLALLEQIKSTIFENLSEPVIEQIIMHKEQIDHENEELLANLRKQIANNEPLTPEQQSFLKYLDSTYSEGWKDIEIKYKDFYDNFVRSLIQQATISEDFINEIINKYQVNRDLDEWRFSSDNNVDQRQRERERRLEETRQIQREDIRKPKNTPPVIVSPIQNQNLKLEDGKQSINLNGVFIDKDRDPLSFIASSSHVEVATVKIDKGILWIYPIGVGSAKITVTASDGKGGSASTSFTVNVTKTAQEKQHSIFGDVILTSPAPVGGVEVEVIARPKEYSGSPSPFDHKATVTLIEGQTKAPYYFDLDAGEYKILYQVTDSTGYEWDGQSYYYYPETTYFEVNDGKSSEVNLTIKILDDIHLQSVNDAVALSFGDDIYANYNVFLNGKQFTGRADELSLIGGLTPGTTYKIRLQAIDDYAFPVAEWFGTFTTTNLPFIAGLSAFDVLARSAMIEWSAFPNTSTYKIFRNGITEPVKTIAATDLTETVITGLSPKLDNWIRVESWDKDGKIIAVSTVMVTTPDVFNDLSYWVGGGNSIMLLMRLTTIHSESEYEVIAINNGSKRTVVPRKTLPGSYVIIDTGLTPDKEYDLIIRVFSGKSNVPYVAESIPVATK